VSTSICDIYFEDVPLSSEASSELRKAYVLKQVRWKASRSSSPNFNMAIDDLRRPYPASHLAMLQSACIVIIGKVLKLYNKKFLRVRLTTGNLRLGSDLYPDYSTRFLPERASLSKEVVSLIRFNQIHQ